MNPLDLYTLDQKSWSFLDLIGQTPKDFITTNLAVGRNPATVAVDIEKTVSGDVVATYLFNLSDTAFSDALMWIRIQGANARYAYTRYSVNGIQDWSIGTLGSDQSLRISRSSNPGT